MNYVIEINAFLEGHTGISSKIMGPLWHNGFKELPFIRSCFFKPYSSKADAFFRAASVATAPVSWSILAVELLIATVITALRGIYIFMIGNPDNEQGYFRLPISDLSISIIALLAAITSPIINLVDVIGSGVTTLMQNNETQEERSDNSMTQ